MITLTIPNDDTIALRQFGKALIEIASVKEGHPVDVTVTPQVISTEELRQAAPQTMGEPEVDTTAQQVESLAAPDNDLPIITVNPTCHALSNEELQERGFDSTGTPWDERIHSTSKALNADGTWRLRRKPKDMDETEWAALVESVKGELLDKENKDFEEWEKTKQPDYLEPVGIDEPTREEVDELIEASNKMLEPPVTPPGDDFHTDADVVTEQTVAGIPPLTVPHLGGSGGHSSQSTPYKLVGSGDDLSSGSGTGIPPLPVPPPVVVAPPVTEWDFPRLMTFLTERHGKIDVATVNTLLAQDGMSSVQELNAHPDKIGPFVARVKAHLGE